VEWQSRATGEDRELAPGEVVAELVSG
jgi:hypothetical protein